MPVRTVALLSYPRSGSTYLRQLVAELQGRPQLSAYPGDVVLPDGPALCGELAEVRLVKTHRVGPHASPAVHLVRDGRDAAVSLLHLKERSGEGSPLRAGDLAAALRRLAAAGEGWPDHMDAVERLALTESVTTVRYDDLVADPCSTLVALAASLGTTLDPAVAAEAVERVARSTAFADDPLNGIGAPVPPGSLFEALQQDRGGHHWPGAFDAAARRTFHEQGATPHLRSLGYETSSDWWR